MSTRAAAASPPRVVAVGAAPRNSALIASSSTGSAIAKFVHRRKRFIASLQFLFVRFQQRLSVARSIFPSAYCARSTRSKSDVIFSLS
jgi:hypothetical protein